MSSNIKREDILRLAEIVRQETGNQVQEKNFSMLESRIQIHMLKLGINSMESYWQHFEKNEESERELMQGIMTTHHTFFFREIGHFEVLENWIESEIRWIKDRYAQNKAPVKVWSAACSRGQEVYSLATFLEVKLLKKLGIPYEIVGTDIDPNSVSYGKNGVYPIKEVNTIPHAYLNGFWKRGTGSVKEFAAVHPTVKEKTRFETLNLLEIPQWKDSNKYDVIFCRNVFIYFSAENVEKIATDLNNRLNDRGLFVSGVSEPVRFNGWTLQPVGPSCYQKGGKAAPLSAVPAPAKKATKSDIQQPSKPVPVPAPASAQAKHYRVLCVDDSPTIQLLIKKIFSQDALCERVDVANNGREAREKLNAQKYDLITLDIHMPEVNGIEFLERLYQRKTDPPVIMISSVNRQDVELATKAMTLGAFDYVEKPAMNNLQKSSTEILTKAKMALRSDSKNDTTSTSFDASISQQIVVPDASQCLRVLVASTSNIKLLELVIKGQNSEYRSPPCVVVWNSNEDMLKLETEMLHFTQRKVVTARTAGSLLKPNHIYLATPELFTQIANGFRGKMVSLQLLDKQLIEFKVLQKFSSVQILIDESLAEYSQHFEKHSGLKLSDLTPATSFPSLSVEFFASFRKAAA